MARFYANENFPLPVVEELRRLGHDVLTSYESGRTGMAVPDHEVLAFSIADQRTVLTLNRKHFTGLHRERPHHTGIVVCTFDRDFTALAQRIHAAALAQADLNGQIIRINRPG